MLIFEVLIFAAAIVVVYLYWSSAIDISQAPVDSYIAKTAETQTSATTKTKEGFVDADDTNINLPNISMCPNTSKAYVAKNGDNLCCDGNPNGTGCEGKTICTISASTNNKIPSCAAYLLNLYKKKSINFCPKELPNYYEDNSITSSSEDCIGYPSPDRSIRLFSKEDCTIKLDGNWYSSGECMRKEGGSFSWDMRNKNTTCLGKKGAFCTRSPLNSALNGPANTNAERCTVGAGGIFDNNSCEVRLALNKMKCPSPDCSKDALKFTENNPVVLTVHFKDSSGISRTCYDTTSMIQYWQNLYGGEWKSKTSHINPDRNIMFCNVAKKYYIDKTVQKKDIDI